MTDVPSPMFHGHNPSLENIEMAVSACKAHEKEPACLEQQVQVSGEESTLSDKRISMRLKSRKRP